MKVNLLDLLEIQQQVNEVVREKTGRVIRPEEFILAFNVEFFEFINEVGTWKWWKHSHIPNKERVLDELADLFAFLLSLLEGLEKEKVIEFQTEVERVWDETIEIFEKDGTENPINVLIHLIGVDNENPGESIPTLQRFAMALFITSELFPDTTWGDFVEAYKKKSEVNLLRQANGY